MAGGEFETPKQRLEFIFAETARGNGQPFLDALAEDAEWTVIGSTGWSRTYRGKDQILNDLIVPHRWVRAAAQESRAAYDRRREHGGAIRPRKNITRDARKYQNTHCRVFAFRDGSVRAVTEYADTELMRAVLGDRPPYREGLTA